MGWAATRPAMSRPIWPSTWRLNTPKHSQPHDQLAPGLERHLIESLTAANRAIHEKMREDTSLKGMGTTVVAMTIAPTSDAGGPHCPSGR